MLTFQKKDKINGLNLEIGVDLYSLILMSHHNLNLMCDMRADNFLYVLKT
jgi:hypothetical protein